LTSIAWSHCISYPHPFGSAIAVVQDKALETEAAQCGIRAALSPAAVQPKMADERSKTIQRRFSRPENDSHFHTSPG
jgi:hypothetical protein